MIGVPGPRLSPEFVPGDRVHGVGPQLSAPRRLRHGLADLLSHPDLVGPHRHVHFEGGHARVLADGPFLIHGKVDVLRDDVERLRGACAVRLGGDRMLHCGTHIRRKVGGRANDQRQHAVEE